MKIGNELLLQNGAALTKEDFGVGNFVATPAYLLGVDASGTFLEVNVSDFLTDVPTLQEVTDAGNSTTNLITTNGLTSNNYVSVLNPNDNITIAAFAHNGNANAIRFRGNSTLDSELLIGDNTPSTTIALRSGTNSYFLNSLSIGTTLNSAKLHIVGSGDSGSTDALLIENSDSNEIFSVADNGVVTIQDPAGANGNTIINNDPALTGTTGSLLTALGYRALRNSSGNRNVGIGYQAGVGISGTGTGESTSVGYYAGNNFVGAGYITAIGSNALRNATTSTAFNTVLTILGLSNSIIISHTAFMCIPSFDY